MMKRILIAALLFAGAVRAQTFYGNMLQLGGSTVGSRPDASIAPRALLYDLDGGQVIYSNGTSWLPMSSGSSGKVS
jgi:hypothetical protein